MTTYKTLNNYLYASRHKHAFKYCNMKGQTLYNNNTQKFSGYNNGIFTINNILQNRLLHNAPSDLKIYYNVLKNKHVILKEVNNESGIYRWVNLLNNKTYIGSSVNLSARLSHYFSINYLEKRVTISKRKIYNALLHHGHIKFLLEILEFCNKKDILNREQYYIDYFKPEYNILKFAGSTLGYKHTEATLAKYKLRKLSISAYMNLKAAKVNATFSPLAKVNRLLAVSHPITIENVFTKQVKTYNSIRSADREFGVNHATLRQYIIKNKLFKNTYIIKKK